MRLLANNIYLCVPSVPTLYMYLYCPTNLPNERLPIPDCSGDLDGICNTAWVHQGCLNLADAVPRHRALHRDLWPRTSMHPKGNSAGRTVERGKQGAVACLPILGQVVYRFFSWTAQRDSSSPMDWSPVQPHVYIYSHRLFTAKQNSSMAAGTIS